MQYITETFITQINNGGAVYYSNFHYICKYFSFYFYQDDLHEESIKTRDQFYTFIFLSVIFSFVFFFFCQAIFATSWSDMIVVIQAVWQHIKFDMFDRLYNHQSSSMVLA